jgi:hypothetical protein
VQRTTNVACLTLFNFGSRDAMGYCPCDLLTVRVGVSLLAPIEAQTSIQSATLDRVLFNENLRDAYRYGPPSPDSQQ